ncbi:hypothetical protein MKQ68_17695 [Chitinophaga horti]|uniref:DUF1735 domain-containing protein n=1 Tax=Chitinophaga horti TaxID=2920382 RepID=A0ABY6IXJ1_9BACT|nr:hypothetical protein [Chitinophaga horti]UYQ91921.1 hypothetical protein MKQ68_17695 [Chitinophaga horti]
MKKVIYLVACCLSLLACNKDDDKVSGPVITLGEGFEEVENLNVGEELTVPVNVKAAAGIRRLAYYFITQTANGTASTTPVYIDKTDYPTELNENIVFKVPQNMVELVIISFDKQMKNTEKHIVPKNVRLTPVLTFKDNVKFRASVFENKQLTVEASFTSQHDVTALTYQTIVDGKANAESPITITNPKTMAFAATVTVVKNMSGIIIKAKNSYNGTALDTFKIGTVVDDAVTIALEGNKPNIAVVYAGIDNTLAGTVFSGSAVSTLTYAVKTNGVYGAELPVTIGTPKDEFIFSITYPGANGIQALRISGRNEGGKTIQTEYLVGKVYNKLLHIADIKLTTEIGAGKTNWFSTYSTPHVLDVAAAAGKQVMLDFLLYEHGATDYRISSAAAFNAGAAYSTAMAPYMAGFNTATYTLVTTNRPSLTTAAFDAINWDGELNDYIANKVKAPAAAGGENYNVNGTNRRFNNTLVVGTGFIIGWGTWTPINNEAFGIVMVKEYSVNNGVATVTLEVKAPAEDNRTKYNGGSTLSYP